MNILNSEGQYGNCVVKRVKSRGGTRYEQFFENLLEVPTCPKLRDEGRVG